MKYLVVLLLLGGTIYFTLKISPGSSSFPNARVTESTEVRDVPAAQRQKVILFTGTSWCGACRHLEKQVISRPEWREFANREISFVSHDIPRDPSGVPSHVMSQMQQYGIRSFPTMLVVDDNGREIDRVAGAGAPVENYKKWIRDHARAAGKGGLAAR